MYKLGCILCLNEIEINNKEITNKEIVCSNCNFKWNYKLENNSPFLNQLLELVKLYRNNTIKKDDIILALNNWLNELLISLEASKINLSIPLPSVVKKIQKISIDSLENLSNKLQNIINNQNEIDTIDFNELIELDKKLNKVFSDLKRFIKKIQDDKYYLLEQYKKDKINVDEIIIQDEG